MHDTTNKHPVCKDTFGTQSKVTVPACGMVAHTQLLTLPGHSWLSDWEPNLKFPFLFHVKNKVNFQKWFLKVKIQINLFLLYKSFLLWPLQILPEILANIEPIAVSLWAGCTPDIFTLSAMKTNDTGNTRCGVSCPHWCHLVYWLLAHGRGNYACYLNREN